MKTQMGTAQTRLMRDTAARRDFSPTLAEVVSLSAWRLPSGKALAEFALEAGLLAPLLPAEAPFLVHQSAKTNSRSFS